MPKTMPPDRRSQEGTAKRKALRHAQSICDHAVVTVRTGGGWMCNRCGKRMSEREAFSPRGT